MIILTILGYIALYLFIGLVLACILLKKEGKSVDKIDAGEDIAFPLLLWPLFAIFGFCCGVSWLAKNSFRLLAIHVLRMPATSESATETGSNPPPTASRLGRTPPQKVVEDKNPIPRSDLIDIE